MQSSGYKTTTIDQQTINSVESAKTVITEIKKDSTTRSNEQYEFAVSFMKIEIMKPGIYERFIEKTDYT